MDITTVVAFKSCHPRKGDCTHAHSTRRSAENCRGKESTIREVTLEEALQLQRVPWALIRQQGVSVQAIMEYAGRRSDYRLQSRAQKVLQRRPSPCAP